jgi:hypothetical protein
LAQVEVVDQVVVDWQQQACLVVVAGLVEVIQHARLMPRFLERQKQLRLLQVAQVALQGPVTTLTDRREELVDYPRLIPQSLPLEAMVEAQVQQPMAPLDQPHRSGQCLPAVLEQHQATQRLLEHPQTIKLAQAVVVQVEELRLLACF